MNKCEKIKIEHAWRNRDEMYGFQFVHCQECANCGLIRRKHSETKEWWSYSDNRPDEPIYNIRPV